MKPRLFLDVDGVVLAHYSLPGQSPCFQMRPFLGSFVTWAHQYFDLYWLTCHGPDSTQQICLYNNLTQFQSLAEKQNHPQIPGVIYAPWQRAKNTTPNLDKIQGIIDHGGLTSDWLVIEDQYPCYDGYDLIHSQPQLKARWIIVPDQEEVDLFKTLTQVLTQYLKTNSLSLPWPQPPVDEIACRQGLVKFPRQEE